MICFGFALSLIAAPFYIFFAGKRVKKAEIEDIKNDREQNKSDRSNLSDVSVELNLDAPKRQNGKCRHT